MKQKTLMIIWAFFAMFFFLISVLGSTVNGYEALISFPFIQIGWLLRKLSLSGTTGNIFALIIYIVLSILPIAYFFARKLKCKDKVEDFLLVIASILLFVMLYLMVNPALMYNQASMLSIKPMLGGSFYSILVGYFVLRLLRKYGESEVEDILTVLQKIFAFIGVVLIYSIIGSGLDGMINDIEKLKLDTTDPNVSLAFTNFFFVLSFILEFVPIMFQLSVIYFAIKLCSELSVDRYSESVISTAYKLGVYCKYSVVMVLLSCITVNILQLIFAKQLLVANYRTNIPLFSIVFALVFLLAAKYFAESKFQKEENDMFI